MNAYYILEQTLNQRDVRVFDYVEDENGNKKPVLNKKETAIAQDRQELIKQKFSEWIWKDIDRRELLCRIYNETFNSVRPREYDGRHITFSGMNPEITLRPHQINAIAHIMYGGNTLLAHEVGAGKTFEMVAAAMEMKRLGLCTKSLIVVPNHITEQWAAEWLQLYPSANILVATKRDFETRNRKKFCARIATGDYDAIIIGHSQFEKIPMSAERQAAILEQQIDQIMRGIEEAKAAKAERYTVKQLERTRKSLETKLDRLNDQSRKDDLTLAYDGTSNEYRMTMKGTLSHTAVLGADIFGNITRMDNVIDSLAAKLKTVQAELADTQTQLENARTELAAPFAREEELAEKTARLKELNILLNMDEKDKTLLDDGPEEDAPEPPPARAYER